MKTDIIFLVFATFCFGLANAGTISSGGIPEAPKPPEGPFTYSCAVTVSEQSQIGDRTCYSRASTEYILTDADMKSGGMMIPNIYFETTSENWRVDGSWENCPQLPEHLSHHRISMVFGRDDANHSTLTLDISAVTKNLSGDEIQSDSITSGLFSQKEISSNASILYRSSKVINQTADDRIIALKVKCSKKN